MTAVDITVGFIFPPSNPADFPGMEAALRIQAGDVLLSGVPDPDQFDDGGTVYGSDGEQCDHPPHEFTGRWLDENLDALQDALLPFLTGDEDRYREYVAEMAAEAGDRKVVLSHLDGEAIRIAAKPRYDERSHWVRTEAMVGAAVDPADVAHELVAARESAVEYVERAFEEPDIDVDFDQDIADFASAQRGRIAELERYSRAEG